MSEIQQIAQTIFSQISVATKMACGMRNLSCSRSADNIPYLNMRVGKNSDFLYIRVFYMPSDTYNVELISSKIGYEVQIQEMEDVYAEQLSNIIYHMVNKQGNKNERFIQHGTR